MSYEFIKQLFKLSVTQVLDTSADTSLRVEFQYIQKGGDMVEHLACPCL